MRRGNSLLMGFMIRWTKLKNSTSSPSQILQKRVCSPSSSKGPPTNSEGTSAPFNQSLMKIFRRSWDLQLYTFLRIRKRVRLVVVLILPAQNRRVKKSLSLLLSIELGKSQKQEMSASKPMKSWKWSKKKHLPHPWTQLQNIQKSQLKPAICFKWL